MAHSNRPPSAHLDLDALLELVGGDLELFREVAVLGAQDVSRLVDAIDRAATTAEVATLAHELKGSLLNLTARESATCADAVVQAARGGDAALARAELSRGREALAEVVALLASVACVPVRAAS